MQNDFNCFTGNRICLRELVTPKKKQKPVSQKLNKILQMKYGGEKTVVAK